MELIFRSSAGSLSQEENVFWNFAAFIEPKYAVGKNLKQYTCDKCHLIFDGKLKYRAHYKEVHNDTGHFFSDHINFELFIEH